MKKLLAAFAVLFLALAPARAEEDYLELPEFPKTKVVVLGTYHMANPGKDTYNIAADDVLSGKRQAEIAAVVEALAAFRPTKIAIESDYDSGKAVNEYKAYLAGEYELERNETDQIGFRLAKMLGHETVYPVDYDWGMDAGLGIDWEQYNAAFSATSTAMDDYGKAAMALADAKLSDMTVGQYLRWMNSNQMIEANHFFYTAFMMQNGRDDWFPGPLMVANWYKRNLLIAHNILRIAGDDGSDRILVIIGQGHAKLLNQFLDESPHFEREDVSKYLPQ